MPESYQFELPGTGFLDSGGNARKSKNRISWDSFCRLLKPRPESYQIELLGTSFVDVWSKWAVGVGWWGVGQEHIIERYNVSRPSPPAFPQRKKYICQGNMRKQKRTPT